MIPYIKPIQESTRVQSFCSDCLKGGKKEPLVPFGQNKDSSHKVICRVCGKVTPDNGFKCYACQRSATLIVCTKGQLADTLNMTYYCEFCFTNLVEEWK